MGKVRLTQLDGKLPNLALMKLCHWHRSNGDWIYFFRRPNWRVGEPHPSDYDRVYGSAIFKFSEGQIAKFKTDFPNAIVGGTGSPTNETVESLIGDYKFVDYTVYPEFQNSIGFTQRGCRLSCKFCVVPLKEGRPVSTHTIYDIWRGGSHPKKLHLLDNDFFGQPEDQWKERIKEIRNGNFRVSFTQGVNVRAITDDSAAALASVQYRDADFQCRRLYTAWDNLKDEEVFFRGVDLLERAGVPAKHLMTYMLIGFDKKETWDRIFHRFDRMVARGIRPYPMVFDNTRKDLKKFQRWVVTGLYRAVPFAQYDASYKSA